MEFIYRATLQFGSVDLFVCLFICLFVCLFVHLFFVCLFVHLFFVCLFVHLFDCLFICLFVCFLWCILLILSVVWLTHVLAVIWLQSTHQKLLLLVTLSCNFLKSFVNISHPFKHRYCFKYGGRCYLSLLIVAKDNVHELCLKQWVT